MDISPKQIAPHVTLSPILNGHGIEIHVSSFDRESVDAWIACIKEIAATWPTGTKFLAFYDFTEAGAMMTPYIRARTQELNDLRQDIKVRNALLVKNGYGIPLLNLFLRTQAKPQVMLRMFHKREDALAWLTKERTKP